MNKNSLPYSHDKSDAQDASQEISSQKAFSRNYFFKFGKYLKCRQEHHEKLVSVLLGITDKGTERCLLACLFFLLSFLQNEDIITVYTYKASN